MGIRDKIHLMDEDDQIQYIIENGTILFGFKKMNEGQGEPLVTHYAIVQGPEIDSFSEWGTSNIDVFKFEGSQLISKLLNSVDYGDPVACFPGDQYQHTQSAKFQMEIEGLVEDFGQKVASCYPREMEGLMRYLNQNQRFSYQPGSSLLSIIRDVGQNLGLFVSKETNPLVLVTLEGDRLEPLSVKENRGLFDALKGINARCGPIVFEESGTYISGTKNVRHYNGTEVIKKMANAIVYSSQ